MNAESDAFVFNVQRRASEFERTPKLELRLPLLEPCLLAARAPYFYGWRWAEAALERVIQQAMLKSSAANAT